MKIPTPSERNIENLDYSTPLTQLTPSHQIYLIEQLRYTTRRSDKITALSSSRCLRNEKKKKKNANRKIINQKRIKKYVRKERASLGRK